MWPSLTTYDLNSIPRACVVEGEKLLPKGALRPSRAYHGKHVPTNKYTHDKRMNLYRFKKLLLETLNTVIMSYKPIILFSPRRSPPTPEKPCAHVLGNSILKAKRRWGGQTLPTSVSHRLESLLSLSGGGLLSLLSEHPQMQLKD